MQTLQFEQDGQPLRMMYMDVPAAKAIGPTELLMHGKNFGVDNWANTLCELSEQGYRVIAQDQIGFGKSS